MQSPVPFFTHSLTALSKILTKAQDFETAKKIKPEVIPNLRLIADMLPFWRQITICCDHAKGAAARLSGTDNPVFADTESTLAELQDRIVKTLAFIATVPDAAFDGAANRSITLKAGPRELTFPGDAYLSVYALPNFYFHMTTAYNILRANGVEIGKTDFLGGWDMGRALVVIDVQGEMTASRDAGYAWANAGAETAIASLIGGFRAAGLPVVHVHHHETHPGATMAPGSPGAAPLPCAQPQGAEAVFVKTGSSAFIDTALESHLRRHGLTDLVIIGGEANMCVESSTRMAGNLGFNVHLAEDALINFQKTLRDGTVMPAPAVLAMSLANLGGSFATVTTSDAILQTLGGPTV